MLIMQRWGFEMLSDASLREGEYGVRARRLQEKTMNAGDCLLACTLV